VARHVLELVIARGHTLVLSNEVIVEVGRVLRYPRLQALFRLTEDDVFEYTQLLKSIAQIVTLRPDYVAPLRDPSDLMVLQTAELGDADVLCSNDADFHDTALIRWCAERGIDVLDEATLLARLIE
jgi:putative PIN family toxin of toxin-antitoxin system